MSFKSGFEMCATGDCI